jgi:beta-xylosidase
VRKSILAVSLCCLCLGAGKASTTPPFVPVFKTDFPDPFILKVGDVFYGYATNAMENRANVQMARSTNLVDWDLISNGDKLHDAMPVLPTWVQPGRTWAPEVIRTSAGFVLHFTAHDRQSKLQCLGTAISDNPLGPFTSSEARPLLCQTDLGGTIDSHPFLDSDGQLYLYFKNDGNNPAFRKPTHIYVQKMTPDGLSLTGEAVRLVNNDQPWEAHVIEAPTMVAHEGRYHLFYSANHYGWESDQRLSRYAMGYATCQSPMGPCTDSRRNPILHSYSARASGCLSGPGHQSVFKANGRMFISFHAWAATGGCRKQSSKRELYIAPLNWNGTEPVLGVSLRAHPPQRNAKR